MAAALRITLAFPRGVYSGSELGTAEELPSPSRVYEAFVAAGAGGPAANRDGRVLVARDEDRAALAWLEENEPLGIVAPLTVTSARRAMRYRWRASPVKIAGTDFEPHTALSGPVEMLWPEPPRSVAEALKAIAREVTHVGKADCIAIANVDVASEVPTGSRYLGVTKGRGPGRIMQIPVSGRLDALEAAHAEASKPGRHGTGSLGGQAPDEQLTGANRAAVELRRFTSGDPPDWPYSEVWQLELAAGRDARSALRRPDNRVAAAVGIHRALIRMIGEDVPSFVTGRDGSGPRRGAGHLAIHVIDDAGKPAAVALLAVPADVPAADRARLVAVLERRPRAGFRDQVHKGHWFTLGAPRLRPAVPYWPLGSAIQGSMVPVILEATGGPRTGGWTLDDALSCSVGYAMRGVLERAGFEWGTGWAFRERLVALLRDQYGVVARARRVRGPASPFVHRVPAGALLVAVNASVDLGRLDPDGAGFVALGRSRHLGGGLLRPIALER